MSVASKKCQNNPSLPCTRWFRGAPSEPRGSATAINCSSCYHGNRRHDDQYHARVRDVMPRVVILHTLISAVDSCSSSHVTVASALPVHIGQADTQFISYCTARPVQ